MAIPQKEEFIRKFGVIAALTSPFSVLEVVVAFLIQEIKISRVKATLLGAISISVLGVFCTLSFGPLKHLTVFGMTFFDITNYLSANVFLTFGALFIVIFTSWKLGKSNFMDELNKSGKRNPIITKILLIKIRNIVPIAIRNIAIGAFFYRCINLNK